MNNVGLWVEDLIIPSAPPEYETETIEGFNGSIPFSTKLGERKITTVLQYEIENGETMLAFNRKIFGWFNPFRSYFLIADEDPSIRYPVRVSNGYQIDELSWEDGRFTLEFIMFNPVAESINIIKKNYDVSSFLFDNQGSVIIDPRKQDETEITFTGSSTTLTITNETTGDVWKYTGSTTVGDTILLKGVQSFKNGASIFRDTNKKLLTFAPGVNRLTISGATEFILSVRTRFYFL